MHFVHSEGIVWLLEHMQQGNTPGAYNLLKHLQNLQDLSCCTRVCYFLPEKHPLHFVAIHFSNGTPGYHVKHAHNVKTLWLLGMDRGIREEVMHVARVKQTCDETVRKLSGVVGQCLCSFQPTVSPSVHVFACITSLATTRDTEFLWVLVRFQSSRATLPAGKATVAAAAVRVKFASNHWKSDVSKVDQKKNNPL